MRRPLAVLLIVSVHLSACTTVQDLERRSTCSVWKEQAVVGPFSAMVANREVELKGKCSLGFWLCDRYQTRMNSDQSISVRGPGLFSDFTKVAAYSNLEVVYEKAFLDSVVSSSPIKIDLERKRASRDVTLKLFGGHTDHQELNFNSVCTADEAAVGAVAIWSKENSK